MSPIFDWLFSQYQGIDTHLIVLELFGVFFGILSVLYSKNNSILVYPTGIVSTLLYVYILFVYGLLGDMIINVYYFSMSVYGWYVWTRKVDGTHVTPITSVTKKENKTIAAIFIGSMILISLVYQTFDKWQGWPSYVDILTTAFFFVGMWLLAKKKIENWIYLLIGNIISVPLYFYKGLSFSALLYVFLIIIAILGYFSWKKLLFKKIQTV
ncbi:nicotinamide riboside transporter PnuC [Mesonia sp. MT50]|uniref:Nicotinamide riboside transporter PnuC n=1 Tax=Mesonia profundi TaxID=3070998 RepID=A0ABU0ZY14_9FLAO|nr:nicotinamide riboside transporter PnuC [Mesonia profundi]MDQ7916274.1 nicotinamide riboside transporter PnuC [Mesonia profundi]